MNLFKEKSVVQNEKTDAEKIAATESLTERKRRRSRTWSVVLIVAIVFLLLAGAAYAVFARYYSMLNVQDPAAEPEETYAPKAEDIIPVVPEMPETAKPDESWDFNGKDVMNIMLIGEDKDDKNSMDKRGNADGQLLVSINRNTKQVVLTSFMRDLSVYVGDSQRMKLNMVYHYYGMEEQLDTIEQNFNIPIDNYILINYIDLINIVDAFGGVTLDVSMEELNLMNSKIQNLNSFLSRPIRSDMINIRDAGVLTLNGVQTAAYLRIRLTQGGDAVRTERLRQVLLQMKAKAQRMNLKELDELAQKILPNIKTDLSQATTLMLIRSAPAMLKYDYISQRIPIDGTWEFEGVSFVTMDFKKNNEYLYYTIYEGHKPN